jgi:hypothetical protein
LSQAVSRHHRGHGLADDHQHQHAGDGRAQQGQQQHRLEALQPLGQAQVAVERLHAVAADEARGDGPQKARTHRAGQQAADHARAMPGRSAME